MVFFFDDFEFDAVEDFFLLDEVELACEVEEPVVVANAGRPRIWTSKQNVRNRAKRLPKELTALQCSAILPNRHQAALTLQIRRQTSSSTSRS